MRAHQSCLVVSGILVLAVAAQLGAAEPLSHLPDDVNAVLIVRVDQLFDSPLARKENWKAKARDAFMHQELIVPPGLREFVIGAELDLGNDLQPLRNYAVAVPAAGVTLDTIAALSGGTNSKLDNRPALETVGGGIVVQAEPNLWLGLRRGGRQALSRWMKSQASPGTTVESSTLQKALKRDGANAPIQLGIDLTNVVSQQDAEVFAADQLASSDQTTRDKAAAVLASVQSLVLSVTAREAVEGEVHIEFDTSTAPLKPVLKDLIPAILNQTGMASDELDAWSWSTKDMAVIGKGSLSPAGVRRFMSIVQPPAAIAAASASPSSEAAASDGNKAVVVATKRYMTSLRTILDDLQATLKRTRDNHAVWYERSAGKIDDLPMKNVDPELLDYSQKVSNSLRYQSQVQKMANIRGGTTKAQTNAGNTYRYAYGAPYTSVYGVKAETGVSTAAIDAAANQAATDVRFSEMKQIMDGLVQVRRKLTEKLGEEF